MKKQQLAGDEPKKHFCSMPIVPQRQFDASVSPNRARIILASALKWANGTVLKYFFFKNVPLKGTALQETTVKTAFQTWKNLGIGLSFQEVTNAEESDIRIGFLAGDGAWSYIGRDIWGISKSERTMNFGWDITNDLDTALHEIGHTLGLHHEHQNPNAGIVWDEEAVYAALALPPNSWSRDTTFHNIIKKLNPNEVAGSNWDPNSIMHYALGAGWVNTPVQFRNGLQPAGGLSAFDIQWSKTFYPSLAPSDYTTLTVGVSKTLDIGIDQQQNFIFKPKTSRKYLMQTFGEMDTLMILFEKEDANNIHYLSGDDDSGTGNNSRIKFRLIKGREYIIRIRILFKEVDAVGGVVIS